MADALVVGQEDGVQLGRLGHPGELGIMTKADPGVGLGVRVAPRRLVMARGVDEQAEPHHPPALPRHAVLLRALLIAHHSRSRACAVDTIWPET
jgi:hypothetical protein